ncbi:hypothetical protein BDV06DRAFT_207795 [Aspergillus oleicola]
MLPPQEAEKASIVRALLFDQTKTPSAFPAFFRLYDFIFCPQTPRGIAIQVDNPAFKSHADILDGANKLCQKSALTREQFATILIPDDSISQRDKNDAVTSIVRVVFMLDCSLKDKFSDSFEIGGYSPARWESSEPFITYVKRAIPDCQTQHDKGFDAFKHRKTLKAWKLKKRYGLQFRPTDNIAEHLLYDPSTRIVQVFHHTAYLKAHLKQSKDKPLDHELSESLKMGSLSPRFLAETLHTIHFILFPILNDSSGRSSKLLKSLIKQHNFDPDAEWVEGCIRDDVPTNFTYQYWNSRLEKLYSLTKNPPPRNRLISWVERHTNERNALTVAILGLFLAALFGLLACLIGIAQLAIAILAWRNPRQPS